MAFTASNPGTTRNQKALEVTRMQLEQAQQIARDVGPGGADLVPALLIALALNRHADVTEPASK